MADYYPLIARAIAGLDPSAPGESRRALYERARAALIAQLRSVDPPLSESEITRERLSLEEAVRKVESEAAQRARDATRSGDASRSGDAPRAPACGWRPRRRCVPRHHAAPGPAGRTGAAAIRAATSGGTAAVRPRPSSPPPAPSRNERPPLGQEDRPPAQPSQRRASTAAAACATAAGQVGMQEPAMPPTRERIGRAAPRPREQRAAGAGHARLPRYRRRRR